MKPTAVRLFEAGFQPLVSVIPPNAPLSPGSRIPPSQRGKCPGRLGANGTWAGYDWLKAPTSAADVRKWSNDGANIGLLAALYPGVDIDTLDPWLSHEVAAIAREVLGPAPARTGRAPKQLLMYRTAEPFARLAVIVHVGSEKHLIEVLGAGRQYLIYGTHPSGVPYLWDRDLTAMDPEKELTWITLAKVNQFFAVLTERLGALDLEVERVGDGAIRERMLQPQADLLAPSVPALREALTRLPNTDDLFPNSRTDYLKVGYAIRAAAGAENDDEGFEIFADWCGRCQTNQKRRAGTADDWRADWRRMHPPYAVGWPWLAEMAGNFGFARAKYEFEADKIEATRAEQARVDEPPEFSDQWLTERVLDEAGDQLRYVHAYGRWYVWDGGRWQPDACLLADHVIASALRRQAALVLRREVVEKRAGRLAADFCSAGKLAAVRTLLRADPRVSAPASAFDSDPWKLNTPAGIIDLKTGELGEHDPVLMCARQTIAAPNFDAAAPEWERFLLETTGGDIALVSYLQRLAGYALTGMTTEQMVAFIWGPGGNGKSVFANALQYVLQDYSEVAAMDSFTASLNDRHPTDLAGLVGARLVVAAETQAGRKWDEQRLKAMTGGDPIKARYMRQDFFTYMPQFTLMFVANHKPEVIHADAAMRRRIHMIPFVTTPVLVDTLLSDKLRAEAPAILAWMVAGCLRWQGEGLTAPPIVLAATADYFEEEDAVGRFLAEACDKITDAVTPLDRVYRAWLEWAHPRGELPGSLKRFSQLLVTHQLQRTRDVVSRRSAVKGLALRVTDPSEELL